MLQISKRLFAAVLLLAASGCGGGGSGILPASHTNGAPSGVGATPTPATSPGVGPAPRATPSPAGPNPRETPTPPETPTPQPTSSPSNQNVAYYYGCPVFTAGDYYNADISAAAIDPNSANYISSAIAAGDAAGFDASDAVYKVNNAAGGTPLLSVRQKVQYHQFPLPYPWLASYYIEPLSDAHAIVVQTQNCHLYESYGTGYSNGVLSAYSGANWDLTQNFVPLNPGNPSSMASGLSLFAGMVKWEDYQSGSINHALDWDALAGTVSQYAFVRPASDTDGWPFKGSSQYQIPYGAHLRLKSSFNTSGWGPESTMVANALKRYGMYLADTGTSDNKLYFANAADGSNPWNAADLAALGKLRLSDFDIITLPPIQHTPGH